MNDNEKIIKIYDFGQIMSMKKEDLGSIVYINLDYNQIEDRGAVALGERLKNCSHLKTLNLTHNQIRVDGAKALAKGLKNCSQLKELNLSYNKIEAEGTKALAQALKNCLQLKSLYLADNQIENEGAIALGANLVNCSELSRIDLFHNRIGDVGIVFLTKRLQNCLQLKWLRLGFNKIGDVGAINLAKNLQNCWQLQLLDLINNKIENEGAKALAQMSKLEKLNLDYNQIGYAGINAFKHNWIVKPYTLNVSRKALIQNIYAIKILPKPFPIPVTDDSENNFISDFTENIPEQQFFVNKDLPGYNFVDNQDLFKIADNNDSTLDFP